MPRRLTLCRNTLSTSRCGCHLRMLNTDRFCVKQEFAPAAVATCKECFCRKTLEAATRLALQFTHTHTHTGDAINTLCLLRTDPCQPVQQPVEHASWLPAWSRLSPKHLAQTMKFLLTASCSSLTRLHLSNFTTKDSREQTLADAIQDFCNLSWMAKAVLPRPGSETVDPTQPTDLRGCKLHKM